MDAIKSLNASPPAASTVAARSLASATGQDFGAAPAADGAKPAATDGARSETTRKAEQEDARAKREAQEAETRARGLRLSIQFHEEAERYVYRDVDTAGKVVRQFPAEYELTRIVSLREAAAGTGGPGKQVDTAS
ncbi:MAG: flagellar protein FlaG [Alphaproteobacteria bacterium]|nr:flagellar protein FlaG [Alphaproteobacteria bacterium]